MDSSSNKHSLPTWKSLSKLVCGNNLNQHCKYSMVDSNLKLNIYTYIIELRTLSRGQFYEAWKTMSFIYLKAFEAKEKVRNSSSCEYWR